ncbi:MAG: hypothetical protein JST67_04235 [Bacteroidetes bacterium]|nr:hypothetical protein [Bacteroidota bacterium]
MKTTKLTLALTGLMMAGAIITVSCKKSTTQPATPVDNSTTEAADASSVSNVSSDIDNMAAESSQGNMSTYRLANGGQESVSALSCATVVRDTVNRIVTATFSGTSPCLDGRTRSGTLIFNYSASPAGVKYYRNPGYTCQVTSQNYMVDGNAISVTKTITNTTPSGFNAATTNMTWSVTASVTMIKAGNEGTVVWSANRVKTLLNTSDTSVYHGQATAITWSKARVGVTGGSSGTTAAGASFTSTITTQLVRDMTCAPNSNYPGRHPFIQGDITLTITGKATRYIDFGNGTCGTTGSVTINGNNYPFTQP